MPPRIAAPALAQELARRGYRAYWARTGARRYAVAPEDPTRRLSRPELIAAVQEAASVVGYPRVPADRVNYWREVALAVKDRLPARDPLPPAATEPREAYNARKRRAYARRQEVAREVARGVLPLYLADLPGPLSGADAWRAWTDWLEGELEAPLLRPLRRRDWLAILRESGHATGEGRRVRVDPRPEAAGAAETA